VEIFAHLFFDFPDRKDDLCFVAEMLNPRSELNILKRSVAQSQDVLFLMRAGYTCGSEAVLQLFGLAPKQEEFRPDAKTPILPSINERTATPDYRLSGLVQVKICGQFSYVA